VTNDWWKLEYNQKNFLDGWGTTYKDIGVGIAAQGNVIYYIIDIGVRYNNSERLVITNGAGESVSIILVPTVTPQPDGSVIHTVIEGDTMEAIAYSYGVSVEAIKQLNGLAQTSILSVGQSLIIKSVVGGQAGQIGTQTNAVASPTYTLIPTYTLYPTRTPVLTQESTATRADAVKTLASSTGKQISLGILGLTIAGMGIAIIVAIILYMRFKRR